MKNKGNKEEFDFVIEKDIPIPGIISKWDFLFTLKHGDSFVCNDMKTANYARTMLRTRGIKSVVRRLDNKGSLKSKYRVWVVKDIKS